MEICPSPQLATTSLFEPGSTCVNTVKKSETQKLFRFKVHTTNALVYNLKIQAEKHIAYPACRIGRS